MSGYYLRDRDELEATLHRPVEWMIHKQADLPTQAAVIAHGVAESQCFFDGSKRMAAVLMGSFLSINGLVLEASNNDIFEWIVELSQGLTVEALGERIRSNVTK